MNDLQFLDETEEDVSESHSKFLDALSQLDKGQRVKKAERSEPTLEVSEFHLVKSGISDNDAIHISDLAKVLGKKGGHYDITKNLIAAKKKAKVLEKPLEKPAAERIKRIVGFKNTKEDLKKWNAVILKNRTAGTLQFPLKQLSMRLEPEFVKRFRIQSDLEKELAALEPQKENIEKKDDEFSLTLKEIITKRKEAARIRAQQSYKEAKARRQNKIKSKKFHRVQRKEKIKLQLKEFEELQKTNPEAALEKLELLDKSRAEERMSLRHKSTGQWAKSKQIKAKYDKDIRQELAQQLSISKELTKKLRRVSNSDEEAEEGDSTPVQPLVTDKENPWVGNTKTDSEINDFIKSYRKYWDEQSKEQKHKEVGANNKSNIDVKQTSEENLKQPSDVEDKGHDNSKSFETETDNKITIVTKSDQSKVSLVKNSTVLSNFEVQDITCSNVSRENQNSDKNTEIKFHKKSMIQNSCDKRAKKNALDDCGEPYVKAKMQKKDIKSTVSTSSWSVESIENNNTQNIVDSPTSNYSVSEQINKMFDRVEEKIDKQIKSTLHRVQEKYKRPIKKSSAKNRAEFKEEIFDKLELRPERRRPILDSALNETSGENHLDFNTELERIKNLKSVDIPPVNKSNASETEIDPNKYINVKPKLLRTDLPSVITAGDDALDDSENDEENYNVISEAFADDDVVDEFRKEKEDVAKKSQPEDIDLTLPGWGCWGGRNIRISNRKKKRFILKFPKEAPRKDENKGDVIIMEDDNAKIKEHQVNELPYPFLSVKDYEASIRMPIGRNFVPENAHKRLIKPAIKTYMGKIIEPMTEDVLIKEEVKKYRSLIPKRKNKFSRKRKVT